VTGPERTARAIAHGRPEISARKLAKKAGVRVEVARRVLEEARTGRRAA
jgi:hypothetical protein